MIISSAFALLSAEEETRTVQDKSWLLHHNNASSQTVLSIRQFLPEKNTAVLKQPPVHLILLPVIFFL